MSKLVSFLLILAIVYQAQSADTTSKCVGRNSWQPLVADDTDAHKYHVCKDGQDIAILSCPLGTVFSEPEQTCVHDETADTLCRQRPTAHVKNDKDSHSFYVCMDGKAYLFQCPAGLVYSVRYQVCVWPDQSN